jgi:hypothetical protein
MKKLFHFIMALIIASPLMAGEVRKLGVEDLSYTDFTSTGGVVVSGIQPVDIRAYGADNTGATDSTSALQTAIDATPDGGVLLVPYGTFKYTTLTISKSITIAGLGWSNRSKENFGDSGYLTTTLGSVLRSTKTTSGASITCTEISKGPRFTNVAILGPGTGTSTAIAFGSQSGYQILGRWSDVLIANFYQGLVLNNVEDYTFDTLRLRGISTEAILIEGGGTNQNVFINTEIQKSGTGIKITWGSTNQFYGGLLQGNTIGLDITPSGDGRVGSFTFKDFWWETNDNNIKIDMTAGSIQHLIFDGNNLQADDGTNLWTMTNPNNRTITWLSLTNNTADSFILNLTAVGGAGPTYANVTGYGNRFTSITNGNATINMSHNNNLIATGSTALTGLITYPAVYTSSGTLYTSNKIVRGTELLGAGDNVTVTLSGDAVFSNTTYSVTSMYRSGVGYVVCVINSSSSFALIGTAPGYVDWIAVGN